MLEDLRGKRLALMGTENGADEVSRICESSGITLVSFGSKAEAKIHKVSDEQCVVDCTDPDVMLPLLKEKKIDGVFLCTSEKVIRACSKYLHEAKMPFYTTLQQWDTLMNKKTFKEYAKQFGISTAPAYDLDEIERTVSEHKVSFPVVVKPSDSCGSVGISICNNIEEIRNAVRSATQHSLSNTVICEKYLADDGAFFQFEVWIRDGKAFFPYVKQRIFYDRVGTSPKQPFIDIAPAFCIELIKKYYYKQIEALFRDIGVNNGHCWFQGIIDDGIPYLFDTGFRLGGGKDYSVTKKEKGIDLIECYIRFALTGQFGANLERLEAPFAHSYAVISVGLKNGLIKEIHGIDEIRNKDYVYDYYQYYQEGQVMTRCGIYAQALCRIYIQADNITELKRDVAEVMNLIEVKNEYGESIILDLPSDYKRWIQDSNMQ